MRAAPPVAVRCSGGWPWRAAQALLAAAAAAAFTAWVLMHLERSPWPASSMALLAGAAAWRAARPHLRELRWDGAAWSVDGTPGRLAVALDLGRFLLLRLTPQGAAAPARRQWLALTAAEAGAAMPALRAALYSRPPQTSPRGRPPQRAAD